MVSIVLYNDLLCRFNVVCMSFRKVNDIVEVFVNQPVKWDNVVMSFVFKHFLVHTRAYILNA